MKIIKSPRRDIHLLKITLIILISVFIMGCVALVSINQIYNRYIQQEKYSSSVSKINNFANNMNQLYTNAKNVAIQTSNYPNIFEIPFQTIIFPNSLKQFIDASFSVSSISGNLYIYSHQRNLVFDYKRKQLQTLEQAFESFDINNPPTYVNEYGTYTYYSEKEQQYKQLVIFCPDSSKGDKVIISIDANKVSSALFDYSEPYLQTYVYYIDSQQAYPLYKSFSDFPDFQTTNDIFEMPAAYYENMHKKINVNGVCYIATTKHDSTSNCTFLSLSPCTEKGNNPINNRKYLWLWMILCFIGTTVSVSIYALRKAYNPIIDIKQKLSEAEAIANISKEQKALRAILESDQIIDEQLEKAYTTIESTFSSPAEEKLLLMTIKFINLSQFKVSHNRFQQEMIRQNIPNFFVNSMFSSTFVWTYTSNEMLVFLLRCNDKGSIRRQIEDFCPYILAEYGLRLSITISENAAISELHKIYTQSVNRLVYSFFTPKLFIGENMKETISADNLPKLKNLHKIITDKLSAMHLQNIQESLKEYYRQLEQLSPDDALTQLNYLVVSIFHCANENKLNLTISAQQIIQKLYNAATFLECQDFINQLIDEIEKIIISRQKSLDTNSKLISNIMNYINENYMNCGLCTDMVAEHFNYANAYLARVFKAQTNESLAEYILNKRLSVAADLLKNSNLKVKEIYVQCGFNNSSYFSALFKKHYGMTPSEFKQL